MILCTFILNFIQIFLQWCFCNLFTIQLKVFTLEKCILLKENLFGSMKNIHCLQVKEMFLLFKDIFVLSFFRWLLFFLWLKEMKFFLRFKAIFVFVYPYISTIERNILLFKRTGISYVNLPLIAISGKLIFISKNTFFLGTARDICITVFSVCSSNQTAYFSRRIVKILSQTKFVRNY